MKTIFAILIHAQLLACQLFVMCYAAEVRVGWTPNPLAEAVISYEVTGQELFGMQSVTKTVTENQAILGGIRSGRVYSYTVRARNARGFSAASPPVFYTAPPEMKLTIQKSSNLGTWADTPAVFFFPITPQEFYRLKIEPQN
jgi:hypothetical protein